VGHDGRRVDAVEDAGIFGKAVAHEHERAPAEGARVGHRVRAPHVILRVPVGHR
jgi:hypothetical protein